MATLSLCMIARDEEATIGRALESARGAVDEALVVDTGSTDGTARAARAAGARVIERAWDDDFSAARNAGLEAARGTHVLILDADEVLAPGTDLVLRAAIERADLLLGLLPLHDADSLDADPAAVVSGARRLWAPVWLPRLARNHPLLRFARRVHESLTVARARAELGGELVCVESPLVHYGEVPAVRVERDKARRNTRLLELALAEDPGDGDLAGFYALELYRAGEKSRARAIGEKHLEPFLRRLDREPDLALAPSPVHLAAVLATCRIEDHDAAGALAVARAALARTVDDHPNLRFLEGVALERLGELAAARRCFSDCLASDGKRFAIALNPGVTGIAARLRLANVSVCEGRPIEAERELDLIDAAGDERYVFPTVLLRAEARLLDGDPDGALQVLVPHMRRPGPPADLIALMARALELSGTPRAPLAEAARAAEPDAWMEPRRRAFVRQDS